MTALIVVLLLIALVVWGLNRNHHRQNPPRMSGGYDIEDRDAARVQADMVHPAAVAETPEQAVPRYALRTI
jgi:hypothetical protein